jgi:hypothetical protein
MPASALSPADWYRHLADLPQAAFCHTPAWARIVREVWGGEATAVLQPTPDGQEALLPLVSRHLGGGTLRWTVSGETGVYGGPLLRSPLPASAWPAFWHDLAAEHGSMTLFVPPGTAWEPPRRGTGLVRQTHRLDLTDGDPGHRYNRGLKARLNRARRLGLTIVAGDQEADVGRYIRLYADTVARWGDRTSWLRPPAYFHALHRHGTPQVRLWLALMDDTPVAGIWTGTLGAEAHYLGGATAQEGLQAGGSHLLLDHAVREAAAAGCRVFDFGASGDGAGLVRFKEAFGTVPVPYGEIRLWAPTVRLYWFLKDSWRNRRSGGPQAPAEAPRVAEEAAC